jgi:hypothetical protein
VAQSSMPFNATPQPLIKILLLATRASVRREREQCSLREPAPASRADSGALENPTRQAPRVAWQALMLVLVIVGVGVWADAPMRGVCGRGCAVRAWAAWPSLSVKSQLKMRKSPTPSYIAPSCSHSAVSRTL